MSYTIEQLLNLEQIRQLLESHQRLSGIAYGLFDTDENCLISTGCQEICIRFHRSNPDTAIRCRESKAFIKNCRNSSTGDFLEYRCKNGMIEVAMPLIIDGRHLATFFAGQFFYENEPPDRAHFIKQAEELGFDKDEYLALLDRVPLFSQEHIRNNLLFLHTMVQVLAETGLKNLRLAQKIERRKQTDRQLMLLNSALNHTRDATYLIDDQLRFIYVNDVACRDLGYSREELLTMGITDIDPDLNDEALARIAQHTRTVGPNSIETRHRAKDGHIFPVEVTGTVFEYEGQHYNLALARDMTAVKAAERERVLLNQAINHVHEAAFLITEDDRFVYVNEEACRFLGYFRDELLGMGVNDISPDMTPDTWREHWRELKANGTLTLEVHHQTRQGDIFTVEVNANFFQYDGIDYNLALCRDITERKKMEDALAIREQEFRSLAENSPDSIIRYDLEHRILYLNNGLVRKLGLVSADEVIGKQPIDIWPDRRFAAIDEGAQRAIATGEAQTVELIWTSHTGQVVFGQILVVPERDVRGCIVGTLAFGRDITGLKQTERQLVMLNHALDHVHEAAFLTELDEGKFLQVNQEACRSLEYSREELTGMSALDIDPNFSPQAVKESITELLRQGSMTFETCHRTKSGRTFPVELTATIFEFDGIKYSMCLVRDITGRKRFENTLGFIAQLGWTDTTDFLVALAQHLGETMEVDYVIIDRLDDSDPGMAETVALYAKGDIIPSMRYPLKDTPCNNVMGKKLCFYREGVQALFPADTLLVEMGVESYIGIPLWDSAGQTLGLIAIMDGKPFYDEGGVTQILQLVATSAAAALERRRSDALLQRREREFRTLAENSPDNIVRYDPGCRMVYVNPRLERTLGIPATALLGKTPTKKPPGVERLEYQARIERVLATGDDAEIDIILPGSGEGERHHHVRFVAERGANGEVTGVLAIGRDITERKLAELQLREKQQHLNDMALELTLSEERERRRIAIDLHDTLGQDLTLTRMRLGGLDKTALSSEQQKIVAEIKGTTENAIHRVRGLTRLLSPPIMESAGLEAALKWLARQIETDYSLQIAFCDDLSGKPVAREFQLELYNCVREMLINVAKHADTATACLTVCREADTLAIKVEDDGVGFDADAVLNGSNSDGFGLFTIKQRIMHMGGTFEICSKPGSGTEAAINVPLLKQAASNTTTGEQP